MLRPDAMQMLVNAQVEVNRIVFEANQENPNVSYILEHAESARHDLLRGMMICRRVVEAQRREIAKSKPGSD